jgi:hypothetical protein
MVKSAGAEADAALPVRRVAGPSGAVTLPVGDSLAAGSGQNHPSTYTIDFLKAFGWPAALRPVPAICGSRRFDEVRRRARALAVDHKPIEAVANETATEIIRRSIS